MEVNEAISSVKADFIQFDYTSLWKIELVQRQERH